jgi:hypothetical protein
MRDFDHSGLHVPPKYTNTSPITVPLIDTDINSLDDNILFYSS